MEQSHLDVLRKILKLSKNKAMSRLEKVARKIELTKFSYSP